ncbi:hypothetical protein SAMN05421812_106235 [Asanoa hainanensis]|uniref:Uncharacterized protein n=1 Tax=Asanoa hainanensis TaxID=560556 RepID=A0A239MTE4_9ACTN|nr:hypothetical protein [Asanoa hainanensis]SNT45374.1 hypothetical protein SAMN05421812_106235 [Asanoa hainanensis]
MGLSADERAQLRSNVEQRPTAPMRWILLAMLVGFGALAAIFAARGGTSELSRPWNIVLPLLPFAVLVALSAPLLIRGHRRSGTPLVEGADARTRRAVTRAIRAGYGPDSRIDDLVVDLREQGTARQLGLAATVQVVGALGIGAAAVVADEPIARVLLALATLALLASAGLLFQRQRQLLAYRPTTGPATDRSNVPLPTTGHTNLPRLRRPASTHEDVLPPSTGHDSVPLVTDSATGRGNGPPTGTDHGDTQPVARPATAHENVAPPATGHSSGTSATSSATALSAAPPAATDQSNTTVDADRDRGR